MKTAFVKALRLSPEQRRLVAQASTLLLAVRLGLVLLPLPRLQRLLDWTARPRPGRLPARPGDLDRTDWALAAAGRRLLGDRPCLAQALAARWLLRRRGLPSELCLGVRKSPSGELVAHAWLESGGRVVIGGPEPELAGYARLPSLEGVRP